MNSNGSLFTPATQEPMHDSNPNTLKKVLNDEVVQEFCIAKVFRNNTLPVNNISFNTDGTYFVTSSYDDQINVYEVNSGLHIRTCYSKKYGTDLVTFTHSPNTVLYASTKISHELRYLSLHDNKFIRYFSGHTAKVTNLIMSPAEDFFISTSKDKTVRLWDLRAPNCQGLLHLLTTGVATFDPEGLIFAIGINNDNCIKLYDVRMFEKGPFTSFYVPTDRDCEWTSMSFSPCGNQLMLNTNGPFIRGINAFDGALLWELGGRPYVTPGVGEFETELDACFSPDSKYIFATSGEGKILVWKIDKDNKRLLTVLNPDQPSAVGCFKFNPKMMMLVSAGVETALWIQREPEDHKDVEKKVETNNNNSLGLGLTS